MYSLGDCTGVRGIDVLWSDDVKPSTRVLRDARRTSKVGTGVVALKTESTVLSMKHSYCFWIANVIDVQEVKEQDRVVVDVVGRTLPA